MSHFTFHWEIKVERSQQVGKTLMTSRLFLDDAQDDALVSRTELL